MVSEAVGFDKMITTKQKIMGLGHRVYKSKILAQPFYQHGGRPFQSKGSTPLYDIAHALEVEAAPTRRKGYLSNVDFYSGLVYEKLGIEVDIRRYSQLPV